MAVRVVLYDEGDGDRAITAASYQFEVAASPSTVNREGASRSAARRVLVLGLAPRRRGRPR